MENKFGEYSLVVKIGAGLVVFFIFVGLLANRNQSVSQKPAEKVVCETQVSLDEHERVIKEFENYKASTNKLIDVDNRAFAIAAEMVSILGDSVDYAYFNDGDGMDKSAKRLSEETKKMEKIKVERDTVLKEVQVNVSEVN